MIGQIFLRVFGQSKFFSGAFGTSQFRPNNFFGAFGASNNSGSPGPPQQPHPPTPPPTAPPPHPPPNSPTPPPPPYDPPTPPLRKPLPVPRLQFDFIGNTMFHKAPSAGALWPCKHWSAVERTDRCLAHVFPAVHIPYPYAPILEHPAAMYKRFLVPKNGPKYSEAANRIIAHGYCFMATRFFPGRVPAVCAGVAAGDVPPDCYAYEREQVLGFVNRTAILERVADLQPRRRLCSDPMEGPPG